MDLNKITSSLHQIAIFAANATRSLVQIIAWITVLAIAMAGAYVAVRGMLHVTTMALDALGV